MTTPLITHVIFRLDIGGLENGLVNLINGLPAERFRHAIVCIDDFTDFRNRIDRDDVEVVAIHRKTGRDPGAVRRLYRTIRRMRPDIVHTRNLAALEAIIPAWLAGVRRRIHGEHGWDINDLHGRNARLRWLRRLHSPFVSQYVAMSRHLEEYLVRRVGISRSRIRQIYNGVDLSRFSGKRDGERRCSDLHPVFSDDSILVGTVGRVHPVKGQMGLATAFVRLIEKNPALAGRVRLVVVGDGESLPELRRYLDDAGVADQCWLAGRRDDIPEILRCLDVFVQPSLAEGISNTVLEAMASGLPVIATDVGGNPELVVHGETGSIVPPDHPEQMADAIATYALDPGLRRSHGAAARARAETAFSVESMLRNYLALYEENLPDVTTS